MQKLIEGVHHFQRDVFRSQQELFQRLARKQQPEVLFITCSDSRVVPNLLTQTEPGDLFILRNAGNIIPAHGSGNIGTEATIEYAVVGLGVKDIIVCGHSDCGAMGALLNPGSLERMPAVVEWLKYAEATRRIIQENYAHLSGDALRTAAVEENVLVQLEHLRTLPAVAAALGRDELKLHGWVYKIGTGEVFAYDPAEGQFTSIVAPVPPALATASGRAL